MGKLETPASGDNLNNDLKINVVRHGPSMYRQPEHHDISTANDLNSVGLHEDGAKSPEEMIEGKEKAIAIVRKSAEEIADTITPDEEITIWSSGTGRTLETARILSEVLRERGIKLREKGVSNEHGVKIFDHIGEVKNFSWSLFEPLMNGGEIEFAGKKFKIDKALTNPGNVKYPEYFTSDLIKNIPVEVKATWPQEYVNQIEKFESFADVTDRMRNTLNRLKSLKDKKYRVILVTHDALTGALVKTFTSDQKGGVNPGQFLSLEKSNDKLVVTRAGDVIEGDSETDITQ